MNTPTLINKFDDWKIGKVYVWPYACNLEVWKNQNDEAGFYAYIHPGDTFVILWKLREFKSDTWAGPVTPNHQLYICSGDVLGYIHLDTEQTTGQGRASQGFWLLNPETIEYLEQGGNLI